VAVAVVVSAVPVPVSVVAVAVARIAHQRQMLKRAKEVADAVRTVEVTMAAGKAAVAAAAAAVRTAAAVAVPRRRKKLVVGAAVAAAAWAKGKLARPMRPTHTPALLLEQVRPRTQNRA
jgi:hypothetical protein